MKLLSALGVLSLLAGLSFGQVVFPDQPGFSGRTPVRHAVEDREQVRREDAVADVVDAVVANVRSVKPLLSRLFFSMYLLYLFSG